MQSGFYARHWVDEQGLPEGGVSFGRGFTISWQRGPLGRGEHRTEPNGAFVEDIIAAAADRIDMYQASMFKCDENAKAVACLRQALDHLHGRTERREQAGLEGTHAPD